MRRGNEETPSIISDYVINKRKCVLIISVEKTFNNDEYHEYLKY